MTPSKFDVAVIGTGLVGLAFAAAARGLCVGLLGAAARSTRVYAISPGSAAFLRELGAWPADGVTPVHAMRVFGDDGASVLEFDAYRAGVPELASIVEEERLVAALRRVIEAREEIHRVESPRCERLETDEVEARLHLRAGRVMRAGLVVGADGARSFVRAQAGIDCAEKAYGQTALVGNFACGRPHRNVAFQWFQGGAVLALLPLPGERVSMVWSLPDAEAERIGALAPKALCGEVEAASRHSLGALVAEGAVGRFPLQRLQARRLIAPRVALIGDAAHVVHPLAGQGANLGLGDARELSRALAGAADAGEQRLLRRYERSRAEPILAMDAMIHGLQRLFEQKGAMAARVRNAGLNLTDRLPVIKNILIRHAMG